MSRKAQTETIVEPPPPPDNATSGADALSSRPTVASGIVTAGRRAAHVVLYDDSCPLCTFQMKVITWLDWFNVVSLLPLSDPGAAQLVPALSREALLEAIHCLTKDGRIHRGARCIRFIGLRMPLAIPLALLLWIPGVIWIAERVYMWISRHRHLLSRIFSCREACALLPARQRSTQNAEPGPKPHGP